MPSVSSFTTLVSLLSGVGLLGYSNMIAAHFQEIIPSQPILTQESGSRLSLDLTFTHPMAGGPVMPMGEPVRFGVVGPEGEQDLRDSLRPVERAGQRAYRADYQVHQPGGYSFYIEPAPYWEPAEAVMIVHYAKVVVDAYGGESNWDRDIGLPVEIAPLSRPYGLWAGNLFRGVVKHDGRPLPYAEVEVEWRNDGSFAAPSDSFVTQVVKSDASGTFSYAMPRAGWWGFAALVEGEGRLPNPKGELVPVELGGVIWVHARDMR
jgi:cobalt/nickel transport protein